MSLVEWSASRTLPTPSSSKDVDIGNPFIVNGNSKWYSDFGKQFDGFL